jgi:hypothetical protein
MRQWPENMSACSLAEVQELQAQNRAWNKELRARSAALVNTRLAKNISQEEYAVRRQGTGDEAAECKRRAMILAAELESRASHPLPAVRR